jgi:chitinase
MLILVLALQARGQAACKVVGYYPAWMRTALLASRIDFAILHVINHTFAWSNENGELLRYDQFEYPELIRKTHAAGVKVLLALGEWGRSSGFAAVTADTGLMKVFLNNLFAYLESQGYGGVDVDWEFPSSAAERQNLTRFIRALRERCNAYNPPKLMTMAISSSAYWGQWMDYQSLVPLVDWFNVMLYDFHGTWTSHAGHNAPLRVDWNRCDHGDIETSLKYLNGTRGIPKQKILLGVPFYGRKFSARDLYEPSGGSGHLTLNFSEIWNLFQ